ncbi:MAG: hypothetical protein LBQ83_06905 [Candidatus Margulisbacteria bacterium]|jgi:hypothetical protein|nr:hypothetical protein [Candidatus Margulisiibacteriota bacterium]
MTPVALFKYDLIQERRQDIPDNYSLDFDLDKNNIISNWLNQAKEIVPISIGQKVISVVLEKEDNGYIAANDYFNIVSAGVTREEAIREFKQDLAHFAKRYSKLPDTQATDRVIELKKRYKELLSR